MAHVIKTKKGNKIVLLNPAEKGKRFARQIKSGVVQETGEVLTKEDKKYRAGYLDARKDSANAYNAKNGLKSKAKPRPKQNVKKK